MAPELCINELKIQKKFQKKTVCPNDPSCRDANCEDLPEEQKRLTPAELEKARNYKIKHSMKAYSMKADIYSFGKRPAIVGCLMAVPGILMYEIMSHTAPWETEEETEDILAKVTNKQRPEVDATLTADTPPGAQLVCYEELFRVCA